MAGERELACTRGDRFPEFSEAVSRAKAYRLAWWEERARNIASNDVSGGQAGLVQFMLKNHDPETYRYRIEHTGADGGPISWETVLLRAEEKRQPKLIDHEPPETSSPGSSSTGSHTREAKGDTQGAGAIQAALGGSPRSSRRGVPTLSAYV
jgi:hypothetical protein